MFKLKKRSKRTISSYENETQRSTIDESQLKLLTNWLDELNHCDLIHLTDDNDLIIMVGGKSDLNQQIFVYSKDIDLYMNREIIEQYPIVVQMSDLARILIEFNYVKQISGQWVFPLHSISLGAKANIWLKSMIKTIQCNDQYQQIDIQIQNKIFSIPYESLCRTTNLDLIVDFLLKNGQIQYNVANKSYLYHFIEPDLFVDKQITNKQKQNDHQLLSYHIIDYSVDKVKQFIKCQFRDENNSFLFLSNEFYQQIAKKNFNRQYLIDVLVSNGTFSADRTIFHFYGKNFSLLTNQFESIYLTPSEKSKLIQNFVELIIQMDSVKFDENQRILVIENDIDSKKLCFTRQHSNLIRENDFRKEDVQQILVEYSIIKKDRLNRYYLVYNQQMIQLANVLLQSIQQHRTQSEQLIDYMYHHQLITFDRHKSLIKLHFTDQTLLLPLSHLESIIDRNLLSTNANVLPFTSEQLTNWLIQNSYLTKKNITDQ